MQDLWLEWLESEIATFHELRTVAELEDVQTLGRSILDLFHLAVQDYLSIPIYKRYFEFILESVFPSAPDEEESDNEGTAPAKSPPPQGWLAVTDARELFLAALQTTGAHFTHSHVPWNLYRDFEMAVLERVVGPSGSPAWMEGVERVREMYRERLTVPHADIAQTLNDYSPFETRYNNEKYVARLEYASHLRGKTEKECAKREATERKLQAAGSTAHAFLEQIEFWSKQQKGDPFYVRVMFERAVTLHCLDVSVWEAYIVFLMSKMKVENVVMLVLNRAVRNCNWSGELWGHRLRIGELFGESEDDLNETFDRACTYISHLKSADQFVILMRNWTGLARRKYLESPSTPAHAETLRAAHNHGIAHFRAAFGANSDFRLEEALVAEEVHLFHSIPRARAVYDALLLSHANSVPLHIAVSAFERRHGRDLARAHWILRQAVGKPGMDDETRCLLWGAIVDLERDCGYGGGGEVGASFYEVFAKAKNVEWIAFVKRIKKAEKLGWSAQADAYSASLPPAEVVAAEYPVESSKRQWEAAGEAEAEAPQAKKARHTPSENAFDDDAMDVEEKHERPKAKRLERKEFFVIEDSNAGSIVRLVGIKPETDPTFFKTLFGTKIPPVDYYIKPHEDGSTDGFIEFAKAEDAIQAALKNTIKVYNQVVEIQRCIPAKKQWTDFDQLAAEKTKIYVSNLDSAVDKPLLRKAFGKYGKIKEIRLVLRQHAGQSIAFSYIEFETARSAEKSLEMNDRSLEGFHGRKISVAISDKSKTKKRVADAKELIISNFTLATTREDLMRLFEQHGTVRDIRILKDQTGVPRGVGFVEYEDEESAKKALAVNGTEIDGKFIAVAPSDPNVRGGVHAKKKEVKGPSDQSVAHTRSRPGLGHASRGGRGERGKESTGGSGSGSHREADGDGNASTLSSAPKPVATTAFVPRNAGRGAKGPVQRLAVPSSKSTANEKASSTTSDGSSSASGAQKSQDDFRKMLLKK
ncbi:hypothetical protein BC830DRAFT_1076687 [Chytriomyces sp. MP71]|nr:hypothetical protein BC830DRAFT_1076687 [Chytriomyces sp. MP71]